ncbi:MULTISPECIES: hypothetical protein [unclassified Bradyrhizobium]|uniref:hypothetical protein n=1 Tax=unclassified Bradyrhizobium TaxID=2631580 RepID=UPI0024791357|nr:MULTISPECIES: hypothetical protein [unclassified Bradyrhizobium]WGR73171.1 hypothetical protein MTX24_10210 [Bradyrhizobium sp. ISRA426]WGR78010.1 hypothetical protein MTX21_35180 [Bradyrhizobium sp. ISRA430]WGR88411.1 hypothetical protein MTX25_10220 [Bradyrhizobium sp. ISRA432]
MELMIFCVVLTLTLDLHQRSSAARKPKAARSRARELGGVLHTRLSISAGIASKSRLQATFFARGFAEARVDGALPYQRVIKTRLVRRPVALCWRSRPRGFIQIDAQFAFSQQTHRHAAIVLKEDTTIAHYRDLRVELMASAGEIAQLHHRLRLAGWFCEKTVSEDQGLIGDDDIAADMLCRNAFAYARAITAGDRSTQGSRCTLKLA